MSLTNVEVIQAAFQEWQASGELAFGRFDPAVVWQTRTDIADSDVYRGHDGVAALSELWNSAFEDPRFEVEDYIDRGDYVVVPMTLRGRIRGSDQDVEMPETWVIKLRGGVIVEVREYPNLEEGLDALGLQEQRGLA